MLSKALKYSTLRYYVFRCSIDTKDVLSVYLLHKNLKRNSNTIQYYLQNNILFEVWGETIKQLMFTNGLKWDKIIDKLNSLKLLQPDTNNIFYCYIRVFVVFFPDEDQSTWGRFRFFFFILLFNWCFRYRRKTILINRQTVKCYKMDNFSIHISKQNF